MRPRIFLGSSAQQQKLLQALTRGLQDIADVDPWTTVFNPGVSTLDRLVELTREVDFAAFVFAQDDWTTKGASPDAASGEASPRDNVVFEAGLFGGALGMRRTFILHANGAKLPTDLLGLTSIRYDPDTTPAIVRQINQKLRKAIDAEGRISRVEGEWWQLSLTARTELEPSAVSLLTISRDRAGALEVAGRSWQADGTLSARYWSEASKERVDPAGIFYFWKGERPRHPNAPQLEGTGEIKLESVDRAGGYFTTRSDGATAFHAPDVRHLPARRPWRHGRAGRQRRRRARGTHRATARGVEGGPGRLNLRFSVKSREHALVCLRSLPPESQVPSGEPQRLSYADCRAALRAGVAKRALLEPDADGSAHRSPLPAALAWRLSVDPFDAPKGQTNTWTRSGS